MPVIDDTTTARTDVDAAAELAAEPVIYQLDPGEHRTVLLPPGGWTYTEHDYERTGARPRRPQGTATVHDAASFVAAVDRRRLEGPEPVVYADEHTLALVAILNDDEADTPGWRDYRVELGLRRTPEWKHWLTADNRLLTQEQFAQHIEDGLAELIDPAPATMLELAQTFHATTSAAFKAGSRLASGQVQFRYEEQVEATAGTGGTVAVPELLKLAITPFVGSERYEVTARFRFRLARGEFTLGYKLDRPHRVESAAFNDVRTAVDQGLPNAGSIAGPAPAAR